MPWPQVAASLDRSFVFSPSTAETRWHLQLECRRNRGDPKRGDLLRFDHRFVLTVNNKITIMRGSGDPIAPEEIALSDVFLNSVSKAVRESLAKGIGLADRPTDSLMPCKHTSRRAEQSGGPGRDPAMARFRKDWRGCPL